MFWNNIKINQIWATLVLQIKFFHSDTELELMSYA